MFNILKGLSSPCTISELVNLCSDKMNRSTVYRIIDLFEKIKISKKIYSGWKYSIELSDKFTHHHHHMSCDSCGDIIAFEETESFIDALNTIENKHGFKSNFHSLELSGYCSKCR
jgi:Fur family ferric uptake transcriptional regulator